MVDHAAHGGVDLSAIRPGDDPDDPELQEAGRRLFAKPSTFLLGVAEIGALPDTALPEVAFAGRSNVGKSSLINALTGRHGLARISNTPGRTREINLFDLGGRLVLVDLPGYGYAKAPKERVAAWHGLIEAYLRGRPSLARVCLLIDARHGPKPSDEDVMALLAESAVAFQLVLTKADLVRPRALAELVADLEAGLARRPGADPRVIATSARTGMGLERLRAALAGLAAAEAPS